MVEPTHLKHIDRQIGIISPNFRGWKFQKCLKPQPSKGSNKLNTILNHFAPCVPFTWLTHRWSLGWRDQKLGSYHLKYRKRWPFLKFIDGVPRPSPDSVAFMILSSKAFWTLQWNVDEIKLHISIYLQIQWISFSRFKAPHHETKKLQ